MYKFIILFCITFLSSQVIADDLSMPLASKYKELTESDIISQPRYAVLIQNNDICLGYYTEEEKSKIPYLNSDILYLTSDIYNNNAEAQLITGMFRSDKEMTKKILKDYPIFLEQFNISINYCHIRFESAEFALYYFKKSADLGSLLAKEFLEEYRLKLGDENYYKILSNFK